MKTSRATIWNKKKLFNCFELVFLSQLKAGKIWVKSWVVLFFFFSTNVLRKCIFFSISQFQVIFIQLKLNKTFLAPTFIISSIFTLSKKYFTWSLFSFKYTLSKNTRWIVLQTKLEHFKYAMHKLRVYCITFWID